MAQMGGKRTPTFFWQGALIILPVAGLVMIGFWSLRQDKVMARQDAVQRANDLARELGPQLWRELTSLGTNDAGCEFQVEPAPLRNQREHRGMGAQPGGWVGRSLDSGTIRGCRARRGLDSEGSAWRVG